ncbi:MAG: VWA domain-containing protein, partial [Bacteroidia bacterium]|nr:VWA domain-containing protein [Bacteroidia bacterium]
MQEQAIYFVLLSGIIALLLALYQYVYKSKRNKLYSFLTLLRFLTYFGIILLILNPKFDKATLFNEKPNLIVALDNSSSIDYLGYGKKARNLIEKIEGDNKLNNKFNIEYYTFGSDLIKFDSISFNESRTNISKVFSSLETIHKNSVSPILLISDGNQTYGKDYEFVAQKYKHPIYSVILGDTITYYDLNLEQLNVNKFAFYKNRFPVEAILNYTGLSPIKTDFIVKNGKQIIYRKPISFSKTKNSHIINFTIPANSVGLKTYKAEIVPTNTEKNITNNFKEFGVEIINQQSNIALVSEIVHPDIGTLKKSIESNEQIKVSILSPIEANEIIADFQLVILYQPSGIFKNIYDEILKLNMNSFTIIGASTDWTFLNSIQKNYSKKVTSLIEEYQPIL